MGLIKNLTKRKVGGTVFGNMLRGAVKNIPVVGAALGNGGMMITQEQADKRDMSESDYMLKYGVKKDGMPVSVIPQLTQQVGAFVGAGIPGLMAQGSDTTKKASGFMENLQAGAKTGLRKVGANTGMILAGVAAFLLGIVLIIKKK